jgi:hypothetical protein
METVNIIEEIKALEANKDLLCVKSDYRDDNMTTWGIWHFVNIHTGLKHCTYRLPMTFNKLKK